VKYWIIATTTVEGAPRYWQGCDQWGPERDRAILVRSWPRASSTARYLAGRPLEYGLYHWWDCSCVVSAQPEVLEKTPPGRQLL
jgi:hypothetical protein